MVDAEGFLNAGPREELHGHLSAVEPGETDIEDSCKADPYGNPAEGLLHADGVGPATEYQ